jgi:hypothetical protein
MSSATATVTPHLRVLRSIANPAADSATPAANPTAPLATLPAGATVVAAVPQSALPQGLLDRYAGADGTRPMVGYLVLVPADSVPPPVAAVPAPRSPAPVAPVAPVAQSAQPVRSARGIGVDLDRRVAHVDGRPLELTYLEFELLAHLTQHPHRVHSRDQLVTAVWGYDHVGDGRTVDVHVARLRRKLGVAYRDSIVTVRRVGYKYAPNVRI